jgi:hypothetical protein
MLAFRLSRICTFAATMSRQNFLRRCRRAKRREQLLPAIVAWRTKDAVKRKTGRDARLVAGRI